MKKDNWILKAFLYTFFIALLFNTISNIITNKFDSLIILSILTILFIFIGIIFDIIGTAVLTAEESTFHAKSSKKIKGAKEGVYLIKNGSRISSICNDVIGDICGIVSGSLAAMIGLLISYKFNVSSLITILIVSSIISSLTVGGKAIGKKIAIKNSDEIIFIVSKFVSKFKRV
jgi:CBS domain containing-hemolysin-like protein